MIGVVAFKFNDWLVEMVRFVMGRKLLMGGLAAILIGAALLSGYYVYPMLIADSEVELPVDAGVTRINSGAVIRGGVHISGAEPKPTPPESYEVGDAGPAGGVVFYDKGNYADGWRYLEVSTSNQSSGVEWGCRGQLAEGALDSGFGDGWGNTQAIVQFHADSDNFNGQDYATYSGDYADLGCHSDNEGLVAAVVADDFEQNGYADWYLPSVDELQEMFLQRSLIGGFPVGGYWTSTQRNTYQAYDQILSSGFKFYYNKSLDRNVRAIRRF